MTLALITITIKFSLGLVASMINTIISGSAKAVLDKTLSVTHTPKMAGKAEAMLQHTLVHNDERLIG